MRWSPVAWSGLPLWPAREASLNDVENRGRRRDIKLMLGLRGVAGIILAVGVLILSLRHVWIGVAFCFALLVIDVFLAYRALRRWG